MKYEYPTQANTGLEWTICHGMKTIYFFRRVVSVANEHSKSLIH
jgi:hypothetical protein